MKINLQSWASGRATEITKITISLILIKLFSLIKYIFGNRNLKIPFWIFLNLQKQLNTIRFHSLIFHQSSKFEEKTVQFSFKIDIANQTISFMRLGNSEMKYHHKNTFSHFADTFLESLSSLIHQLIYLSIQRSATSTAVCGRQSRSMTVLGTLLCLLVYRSISRNSQFVFLHFFSYK